MSARIEGLILDLDDTLFDSEAAYVHALETVGLEPRGPAYFGARAAVKARLGDHVCARNRVLYFKELLEREGRFSPAALRDLMLRYESALGDHLRTQWSRSNEDPSCGASGNAFGSCCSPTRPLIRRSASWQRSIPTASCSATS